MTVQHLIEEFDKLDQNVQVEFYRTISRKIGKNIEIENFEEAVDVSLKRLKSYEDGEIDALTYEEVKANLK